MEKGMKALKTRSKNLLNMTIVINYLNSVFHIEIILETKSSYKIMNLVFPFTKSTKWHFGCTD